MPNNRLALLWRCITGPVLYARYNIRQLEPTRHQFHHHYHQDQLASEYEPHKIEAFATTAISSTLFVFRLLYALWPIVLPIMYRRNYFSRDGGIYLSKAVISCLVFFAPVYFFRGLSRYLNNDYVRFIKVLDKAQNEATNKSTKEFSEALEELRNYDFEFHEWPVNHHVQSKHVEEHDHLFKWEEKRQVSLPQFWLNSMLANFLGVRMIYPGCTALINAMIHPQLVIERTKWLAERGGKRFKVKTHLNDEIDTCFVDRRLNSQSSNGDTLVIACEGNAGFWEVGAMTTPNPLGYSLLGWNHPGFAGSSGWPFPPNDRAAIAAVYHFATTELGFKNDNIVLFAWSIGGYSSSWLASVANPPVKALILDATFDNIIGLGKRQMPDVLHPFVVSTLNSHFNLDVVRNVKNYSGPVQFIRRTRDEIISLVPGILATNCINNLIAKTLNHRYPALLPTSDVENQTAKPDDIETLDQLYTWMAEPLEVQTMLNFKDRSDCRDYIKEYGENVKKGLADPKNLGSSEPLEFRRKLLAYVLLHCVKDFSATHCQPLPEDFFRIPTPLI